MSETLGCWIVLGSRLDALGDCMKPDTPVDAEFQYDRVLRAAQKLVVVRGATPPDLAPRLAQLASAIRRRDWIAARHLHQEVRSIHTSLMPQENTQ